MIVVSRVPWLLCQESHVRITVSYGNFHHMTYSVIGMSVAGVQPSRWQVTLHLCRYGSILQVYGNGCTRYLFTQGYSWRTLTNKALSPLSSETLRRKGRLSPQFTLIRYTESIYDDTIHWVNLRFTEKTPFSVRLGRIQLTKSVDLSSDSFFLISTVQKSAKVMPSRNKLIMMTIK